jgi:AraC-like DNA-binding protein
MSSMYVRYIPSPPLKLYINNFYYLDGSMPFRHAKILPLPPIDMKFNLGSGFKVYKTDDVEGFETFNESWMVGISTRHHTLDWPTEMRLFGINFRPEGAYPFLRLSMSELHNHVVPLNALWGHWAAEVRERLYDVQTIEDGFALLEQLLLTRLCEAPSELKHVKYAITEIARHAGTLGIRKLSEQIGISQNHLETQFKRIIGITPKQLARLYRFEHVLQSIDVTQPVDWSLVAHQSLYYDQAHFNKDFVAFTGHTPTDYLQLRRQAQSKKVELRQLLRNLPTD